MDWSRWTTLLGPESEGIWPPYTNVTDINSTCTTNDMNIIATGDDFGLVKLFKFPSKEKHAKCKKYVGHSSHVTSVRFTADDTKLISAGGAAFQSPVPSSFIMALYGITHGAHC